MTSVMPKLPQKTTASAAEGLFVNLSQRQVVFLFPEMQLIVH
jgi:hypothetical protein